MVSIRKCYLTNVVLLTFLGFIVYIYIRLNVFDHVSKLSQICVHLLFPHTCFLFCSELMNSLLMSSALLNTVKCYFSRLEEHLVFICCDYKVSNKELHDL